MSVRALDVKLTIKGDIYIPTCKIENDSDFSVHFGKLSLQKVDGKNYAKSITVNLTCDYFQGVPYIRLRGEVGGGGAPGNVINTIGANASALGIALYSGDSVDPSYPLLIGSGGSSQYGYRINKGLSSLNKKNSQFTFTAVPYKITKDELNAGEFQAFINMNITYI